jgi:hypothetical protein
MQHAGAFSVDREGRDRQAIQQAVTTLVEGRYALTVFPEGNVYLTNDRITPFLEGAAFIGMKAQKKLVDYPTYAVPVSIKVTHMEYPYPDMRKRVRRLAEEAQVDLNWNGDPVSALKHVGVEILKRGLDARGYPCPQGTENDLPSYLNQAAELIVIDLEKALDIRAQRKTRLIDRVRNVRRMIHGILTNHDKKTAYPYAAYWADEAMFALRILSYPGEYLDENPTLDRFSETVEKLTEDFYRELQPPYADRHAYVYFNDPINLAAYQDDYRTSSRATVNALTRTFEQSVQDGVDKINRANPYPGGRRLEDLSAAVVH